MAFPSGFYDWKRFSPEIEGPWFFVTYDWLKNPPDIDDPINVGYYYYYETIF